MTVLESVVRRLVSSGIWRAIGQEQHLRARQRRVQRADLGDKWPLTVDEITLYCHHDAVYLTANGKRYWVNGWARGYLNARGIEADEVDEIWASTGASAESRKDIGPLLDLGQSICEDDGPARFEVAWWRAQCANAILIALKPLTLTATFLSLMAEGVTRLIRGKGGKMLAVIVLLVGLGVTWLTAGIFLQELWEGLEGLWRRPFREHGIYFVIAVPVMLAALAWYVGSHRRE